VPQAGAGVAVLQVTSPPTLLGGAQAGRDGLFLAWYWALALVAGYLLTWAWYRRPPAPGWPQNPGPRLRRHRHRAGRPGLPRPLLLASLSSPYIPVGLPVEDLWVRGTFAFLVAAAGLWVLAWAERSRALAVIALAYTGAALLAGLYNVENLLYPLGWNPGYGIASARLAMLPNVLLPALVLLVAGAGAFFLRPRPGRA